MQGEGSLRSSEASMSSSSVTSGSDEPQQQQQQPALPSTPSKSIDVTSQSSSPAALHSPILVEPHNPFESAPSASSGSSIEGGLVVQQQPQIGTPERRAPQQPRTVNPAAAAAAAADLQTTLAVNSSLSTSPDHSIPMNASAGAAGSIPGSPAMTTTTTTTTPRSAADPLSVPNLPAGNNNTQGVIQHHTFDDDENTAPSSAALSSEQAQQETARFTRFIDNARRRMSSARKDTEDDDIATDGALIAGYLQKLGRNGKWQTRWFETDGECLSYYKSAKRSKLLATLDLEKVGNIEVDMDDPKECSFRIQVLGRLYHLRADTPGICKDWVITLNRVKEARLHQGNVKLNRDFLQDQPRVVVVSNRQRTRAVDGDQHWDQLIMKEDPTDPAYISQRRRSALSTAVVARWSKRHSTMQRLGTKLSKWAKSLKKYSCAEIEKEKIYLDRHVHPPGHDDKKAGAAKSSSSSSSKGLSSWIDKEASEAANAAVPKPATLNVRSPSTASDYDSRMIS